jgi:hypothetical protein
MSQPQGLALSLALIATGMYAGGDPHGDISAVQIMPPAA